LNQFSKFRAKAIPDQISSKLGYRKHPVDLSSVHSRNNESLVDIRAFRIAGDNFYYRVDNPPYFRRIDSSIIGLYLRKSVASLLAGINDSLAAIGLELYVFDAFRPIQVQNYMHDVWFPQYLLERTPNLTPEELQIEVEKYWAKGADGDEIDPYSPPPHSTGAAVDLTIRSSVRGDHLFMGSIFDDVSQVAHTAHYEKLRWDSLGFSDVEAAQNRRLLFWLMREHGFVNNPTEWWHFSWGDQMWAKIGGMKAALYSFATRAQVEEVVGK
jgi:D-alanyl-D-alanine dipeptidase